MPIGIVHFFCAFVKVRYNILKAHDLIASPDFMVLTAADSFENPTTRPNELWQTDFTYFKVLGWGWYYLSMILDDYSRYVLSWKLSPMMKATDARKTIEIAIAATGSDADAVLLPRAVLRQAESRVILKSLRMWMAQQRVLPKSSIRRAIKYADGIWRGLEFFLTDPRIPLDNNQTERAMRRVAVGRKNHYGSKSLRGTQVAAQL